MNSNNPKIYPKTTKKKKKPMLISTIQGNSWSNNI